LLKEVNDANATFGRLGERVLAFARCRLPAGQYPKDSYQFDVKNWKDWGYNKEIKSSSEYLGGKVEGAFPMHDLCFVCVVSLNVPPRQKVDLSVNKCRSAGIKVIMVTGD
jgi:magnesium-transporting ATPase (P-type)